MTTRLLSLAALLTLASAAVLSGDQAAGQRDLRTGPVRGTGGIAGFVIDEASGQPLRRAEVTLIASDQAQRHVSYTDTAGSFMFANLPPGRYSLSASRPGWVRAAYGARRFDRRGTPIHLAAGQTLTDLRLGTYRGGVITGQVLDETGLPAAGIQVRALEYRTVLGRRQLMPVAGMVGGLFGETTDDRGTYRLYGLPPGEYVVVASPRMASNTELVAMTDAEIREALQAAQQAARQAAQPAATVGANTTAAANRPAERRPDGVTVGYAPVFYPGTTNVSSATAIVLGNGEARESVDFQIQLVRTGRVEGTVVPPPGVPPQAVQVMLTPESDVAIAGIGLSVLNRATPDAEGRFTFRSVVPGRYTLSARAVQGDGATPAAPAARTMIFQSAGGGAPMMMSEGGSDRPAFWASSDITMTGENVDNQVLALQPAMTMTGTVHFTGNAQPPADLSRVRLTIMPAPAGGGPQIMTSIPRVTVAADGTFTATNLTPGRYVINGIVPTPRESFTPVTWRIQSAVLDGRDAMDFPLEVSPNLNLANVAVTFSDVTQSVSGTLQDASGRPATDYTIVVFAADAAYWLPNARRVRTTRPGTDGRFTLDNLPPGEYRMAAVVDMAEGEAWDPAFLEQLVPGSFAFPLAPGEKKVQDMRIATGGL